jgi:SecD/SecF fusion protein
LLTIMGYSLYDTVIVFDRLRENVPRMPRATFSQIANRSMSEVLTRSLATSFSTLAPIAALLFFGGETLRDFAFALLVGTMSGAYSSIFIATPVLVEWKEREPVYMRRRKLVLEEHAGLVPAFATAAEAVSTPAPAAEPAEPRVPKNRRERRERAPRPTRPPAPPPAAPTPPPESTGDGGDGAGDGAPAREKRPVTTSTAGAGAPKRKPKPKPKSKQSRSRKKHGRSR